jgi:hypothetical protein
MFLTRAILYATILLMAAILGANVYTSVVDAPNWGSSIPASMDAAKHYFAVANPGAFFRIFAPAAQVAALISVIVSWRFGWMARGLTLAALALMISGDILTFSYFYPRNELMFGTGSHPVDILQNAWSSWSEMNHFRSGLILTATLCEMAVLSIFERSSGYR